LVVNARHRRELNAAIVAHCEWLNRHGIELPAAPEVLAAAHVLEHKTTDRVWTFSPGAVLAVQRARYMLRRRGSRRGDAWRRSRLFRLKTGEPSSQPNSAVEVVVASLHSLCAFRTRLELDRIRNRIRDEAEQRVKRAPRDDGGATMRAWLPAAATSDDGPLRRVSPSLEVLQKRLRTAGRSLERFCEDLNAEHERLAKADLDGWSRTAGTAALARLLTARCDILNAHVAFFLSFMQGPAGAAPAGHRGSVDAKAWHRLRGETKLRLTQVRADPKLGVTLFPDSFGPASDPDARRMQNSRERKEIERAKRARKTRE
jgi:hypothetical protein